FLSSKRDEIAVRLRELAPLVDEYRQLEAAAAALAGDPAPPRPERWGGYRLTPEAVELWEARPDRLHERLRYVRDGGGWRIERLAP
ncbi:MAG: pyridoxine 5'-phosphate oxidase C-terminal domain-containing protein, partial [Acidimicrobiales bacterium]